MCETQMTFQDEDDDDDADDDGVRWAMRPWRNLVLILTPHTHDIQAPEPNKPLNISTMKFLNMKTPRAPLRLLGAERRGRTSNAELP